MSCDHRNTMEIPEPAISLSNMGSNWEYLGFSHKKEKKKEKNVEFDRYVTCIYCGPSVKTNRCKTSIRSEDPGRICSVFVFVWSANTPQFEPCGWRCHYTGQYKRSGSSLVYLWLWCNLTMMYSNKPENKSWRPSMKYEWLNRAYGAKQLICWFQIFTFHTLICLYYLHIMFDRFWNTFKDKNKNK